MTRIQALYRGSSYRAVQSKFQDAKLYTIDDVNSWYEKDLRTVFRFYAHAKRNSKALGYTKVGAEHFVRRLCLFMAYCGNFCSVG